MTALPFILVLPWAACATRTENFGAVRSAGGVACRQISVDCGRKAVLQKYPRRLRVFPLPTATVYLAEDAECSVFQNSAPSLAEAEEQAMACCETSRKSDRNRCSVLGAGVKSSIAQKCAFRFASAGWFKGERCECPDDHPHYLENGNLLRRRSLVWESGVQSWGDKLQFEPDENKVCVDECFANAHEATPSIRTTAQQEWPVVFLVVYKLFGPVVHSNLAFCPTAEIMELAGPCQAPMGSDVPDSCRRPSFHKSTFAAGHRVPEMLQHYGCREIIFDGNGGGGVWQPPAYEVGCWAQGVKADEFWWGNGNRKGLGHPSLYWLTSDNGVPPFAASGPTSLEAEMGKCFSSGPLGQRLDFNPGTYSLLHHNCNKFSTEAMRYLGLPRFADDMHKGAHSVIALSSTQEESLTRRVLGEHALIMRGEEAERSRLSRLCSPAFDEQVNCRRMRCIMTDGGRKGDCPLSYFGETMRCYDPSVYGTTGLEGLAPSGGARDPVNGKCGISIGERCISSTTRGAGPCQPGAQCIGGFCSTSR